MFRVYYGWVVVAACFIGSFVVFGLSYSFGVFFEEILSEFGYSRSVTAVAFGIQTLSLYIGAGIIGALIDRFGSRQILVIGSTLLCVGLFGTSQADSFVTLVFFYGIVTGFGMSVVYIVSYATVPRWFERRQGFAAGIASAGLGAGMLAGAPASTWLIAEFGWRNAVLVLTFITALLLGIITLLIRDDPHSVNISPPESEFAAIEETSPPADWRNQYKEIRQTALQPSFVLLFIGWTLIYTTLYIILAHLVVHITELGHSRGIGATAIALIGLSTAFGRVFIGYLGDRTGRIRTFIVCSSLMGLSTAFLPLATSISAIFTFAIIYGLVYGGNGALLAPVTADLFGRININAVFGLISLSFAVAGLLTPSLAGAGYDSFGTYNPAFVISGAAAICGAICILLADRLANPRMTE